MVLPLIVALVVGEPPPGVLTQRIAQSAAAAQAFQGPMDGSWRFREGGVRRDLEFIDSPSSPEHVGGAWRDGNGTVGYADLKRVSTSEMELTFDGEYSGAVRLTRGADGAWRGERQGRAVVLERRRLARER